jgi:hypothetical protein
MNTRKAADDRFMLSPDGVGAAWVHPLEVATRCPGWTDVTDLSDEAFQRLVCERQSQPRIVSLAVAA